jgi:hypothetical protein
MRVGLREERSGDASNCIKTYIVMAGVTVVILAVIERVAVRFE